MNTGIKIDLTEAQINNAIAIAIAEAFTGEARDAMLRDLIRGHLAYKADRYGSETLIQKVLNETLKAQVDKSLREHLETLRPEVDALVKKMLGKNYRANILDQLQNSLSRLCLSSIYIEAKAGYDID